VIDQAIQLELLRDLYIVRFDAEKENLNWRSWGESKGFPRDRLMASFEDLRERGLVKATYLGGGAEIALPGILLVEKSDLVDQELIARLNGVRFAVMDAYARTFEVSGPMALRDWEEVSREAGVTRNDFLLNYRILIDVGFLETITLRAYRATLAGRKWVAGIRARKARVTRMRELAEGADVTPHARGHELERILEEVIASEGWGAERNVRGPGEEHDLVIHRDRDFFFAECRWRKEVTESGDLSKLRDRVSARAGAGGIFITMSSFSAGAIRDAEDRLEKCILLLFGPRDVEAIVTGQRTFTDLLNAKHQQAVSRRRIIVDET